MYFEKAMELMRKGEKLSIPEEYNYGGWFSIDEKGIYYCEPISSNVKHYNFLTVMNENNINSDEWEVVE